MYNIWLDSGTSREQQKVVRQCTQRIQKYGM